MVNRTGIKWLQVTYVGTCADSLCVSRFLHFWHRSELRRERQHLKIRKTVSALETQLPTSHNKVQITYFRARVPGRALALHRGLVAARDLGSSICSLAGSSTPPSQAASSRRTSVGTQTTAQMGPGASPQTPPSKRRPAGFPHVASIRGY